MSVSDVAKPRDPLATLRISRTDPARPRGGRRRWWRRLLVLIVLLALGAGGIFVGARTGLLTVAASQTGLLAFTESLQSRPEVRVASVSVTTGRSGDATVVATGYLESRQQAKIGARAPGRLETLKIEEGLRVERGEVLAVLEHDDLKAALAAAVSTLARSKAEVAEQEVEIARTRRAFEREDRLRRSKSSSESAYDDAKFRYEAAVARLDTMKAAVALAEARVREAEQMTANMVIRAPFNGTVISKDAELGESILPGGMGEASGRGSVATIADLEHLEVDCDVKEDYISRVKIGQSAEVAVDAVPDRRYAGRVRKIIPMGDRARATIKVKVEIVDSDGRLFPEMSSTVYFLPDESQTRQTDERRVFCPSAAIAGEGESDDGTFVWLVGEGQRLARVPVKTGPENNGQTEILSGLSGGERVVVRPAAELREGQRVKVSE